MSSGLSRFIAACLAVLTLGAGMVCGCPNLRPTRAADAAAAMTGDCVAKGSCCHRRVTAHGPGVPATPCDQCNLLHRVDQISPEDGGHAQPAAADLVLAGPLAALACPVPLIDAHELSAARSGYPPLPPLLHDLFHARALLLI